MKKTIASVLALMLCLSLLLAACGGGEGSGSTTLSNDAPYRVTVVDAAGTPYTEGVIVRFLQNGQQAAMQPINAQGVAEKTLVRGDYTVELIFTDTDSTY